MPLLLIPGPTIEEISGSVNLSITGSVQTTSNTTLFVSGEPAVLTKECTLNITGIIGVDSNINLFTDGVYGIQKTANLFIEGTGATGYFNLHQIGHILQSKTMNLSLKTIPGPSPSANEITLFVKGGTTGVSDLVKSMDLYLEGIFGNKLNLYIQNDDTGAPYNKRLNLFIQGRGMLLDSSMPLYLSNEYVSKQATLFIKGSPATPIAAEAFLNLFINRMPAEFITLVMFGPANTYNTTLNLSVTGAQQITGTVDLSIPVTVGVTNDKITLYTHGF